MLVIVNFYYVMSFLQRCFSINEFDNKVILNQIKNLIFNLLKIFHIFLLVDRTILIGDYCYITLK